MRDLFLDAIDDLKLKYRSKFGFKNFFHMKSFTYETLLNLTAKKFSFVHSISQTTQPSPHAKTSATAGKQTRKKNT